LLSPLENDEVICRINCTDFGIGPHSEQRCIIMHLMYCAKMK